MIRKFRFLFPVLTTALALPGCMNPECENEVREELVSPDRTHKVVIFSRNCGVTTGFNCQASILPVGASLPDDGGNAFIFDHGEAKVAWLDAKTLSVSVGGSARTFKREEAVQGIKLVYSEATEARDSSGGQGKGP